MPKIPTLHYALFSPPARACMLTAKLIDLELDLKFVDFSKKEHLSVEFIKLNPQHQIPVLVDDGEVIWDSHAIMCYMVSKWAKDDKLYPKDLVTRARVDQRLHFESGVLFQIIKDMVARIIYGNETEINPKTIENAHTAYDLMEKFLNGHEFFVGNHLTIADISIHTTLLTLNKLIPVVRPRFQQTSMWLSYVSRILPENKEINEAGAEQLYLRILSCLNENRKKVGLAEIQPEEKFPHEIERNLGPLLNRPAEEHISKILKY
ncbi:glutathione S-transferase 1 [Condylostylus longicornis]|uniref:glutathione S-transferase 1 n=1 Tax=Condylostylus longicornis TaxID=2530218 RepID=UPI00244E3277|nr:glutathione S-transferase 1 [Condylostylus longicornis]